MDKLRRENEDESEIIIPLRGKLVPVPTVQETNPSFAFGNAYAVEIIQKSASQVIKVLDREFPKDSTLSFTHLRRFVKWEFLPVGVREQIEIQVRNQDQNETDGSVAVVGEGFSVCRDEEEEEEEEERRESLQKQSSKQVKQAREQKQERQGTIYVLIPPPLPDDLTQLRTLLAPFTPGAVSSSEEQTQAAQEHLQEQHASKIPVYNITIPLQPPLNSQQAESWSKTYWPTIFNAAASRGMVAPPSKILETTKSSLESRAGFYLALAGRVAREAKLSGRGRGIGVVVVDPALAASSTSPPSASDSDWKTGSGEDDAVVAVAGDARYCTREARVASSLDRENTDRENQTGAATQETDRGGGPEFHAMMRAIEMVATKRRDDKLASTTTTTTTTATTQTQTQTQTSSTIHGTTLSSLESYYLCRPASSSQYPNPPSTPADADTGPDGNKANRILPRSAGGYLCTDLDVYITHEPCLACSMGMLLSRFRTITFPRRGRLVTGGLASSAHDSRGGEMCSSSIDAGNRSEDSGGNDNDDDFQRPDASGHGTMVESTRVTRETYYGLHWRKELNWRAMCFEFIDDDDDDDDDRNQGYYDGQDGIEAVGEYHA